MVVFQPLVLELLEKDKLLFQLQLVVRQELQVFEKELLKIEKPRTQIIPKSVWEKEEGKLGIGDFVKLQDQETFGQVLSINGKEAEILFGELKSVLKLNRLEKVSKKEYKASIKETPKENLKGYNMNEKLSNFSFNLDIRGKRGDEALTLVDSLLDDAIFLGYPQLRIVHGKGDGILRNLIKNHLKSYKQIKSLSDEHADRGGQGVTLVDLK